MAINKFSVNQLHGIYDYEVDFNEDVTFIYGSNGCGKTTILNLITIVITGNLFRLFDYNFKSIELKYTEGSVPKKILIVNTDESSLKITYNDKSYNLKRRDFHPNLFFDTSLQPAKNYQESLITKYYSWLKDIKTSFNFIYLPLSRNNNTLGSLHDRHYESDRYISKREFEIQKANNIESSLALVKNMISENYTQISSKINRMNEDFRNNMFTSFFHFHDQNEQFNNDLLSTIGGSNTSFYKSKDKILKTFKDIGILSEGFVKEINKFYDSWKIAVDAYNKSISLKAGIEETSKHLGVIISNYARINQILEITTLADKMDIQKEEALSPINKFLTIINSFFKKGECSKEIKIDTYGRIYFVTPNCPEPIDIEKLSSGEQQLLIFFAYLILGLKDKKQGIFIVDEPELSLHLAWQRKYVESILETSDSVQLIFATHSPEMISKYRDKRFRLIPKAVKCSSIGGEQNE